MDALIRELTEQFKRFPGIGERQAKRFVYFLLYQSPAYTESLIRKINELKKNVLQCKECMRFYTKKDSGKNICSICSDQSKDKTVLLVVEKDVDMEALERSKIYQGTYFVLGGLIPIIEKKLPSYVRYTELMKKIEDKVSTNELEEIVLGFSMNPSGEFTDRYIRSQLEKLLDPNKVKITSLGRGLSTGSELEYADSETLKYALENRKQK